MASYTRLIVLGAVYQFQPVHGYFLRRELATWHVDEWANVRPGSIYNALKSLNRDEYIIASDPEAPGNYPARTKYTISSIGKVELLRMLRSTLWNVEAFDTKAVMALTSFMFVLSRPEVVTGLQHRIKKIDAIVAANDFHIEDTMHSDTTPKYVQELFKLSTGRLRAEQQWAEQLVESLNRGDYQFADEVSGN